MTNASSPLAKFFSRTGERKSAFARRVGVTPARITQIINGDTPSLTLALRIEEETAGEVTPRDLLGEQPKSPHSEAAQ